MSKEHPISHAQDLFLRAMKSRMGSPESTQFAFMARIFDSHNRVVQRLVVPKIEMMEVSPTSEIPDSFNLEDTACQRLIDDLWNCGFRPTEGTGSAGAMAAVQRHLEDMRSLVFKTGKALK